MFFILGLLLGFRELEVSTPKGAKKRSHPQAENDNAVFQLEAQTHFNVRAN